ncbi:hypothetical protein B4100_2207 [Heyndrickxia coagulans]|nr:hypothetical protein B4100_2207 [Heyndrickxia coagulans]
MKRCLFIPAKPAKTIVPFAVFKERKAFFIGINQGEGRFLLG